MLLASLCAAVFTFTSCLNSDDDQDEVTSRALSETEIQQYLSPIMGYHIGNLKAYFQNEEGKQDSAVVTTPCTVSSNKTITFAEFPVSILKNYFPGDTFKDLREALEQKEDQPLIANMTAFWNVTNNTTGQSNEFFYTIPNNKKLEFTLNYGEREHRAVINFTESVTMGYTSFASQGYYNPGTSKLHVQFIIYDFVIDDFSMLQYASLTYADV